MDRNRDNTEAAALQIAHQHLVSKGWNFTIKDVGERAREIISALDQPKKGEPRVTL